MKKTKKKKEKGLSDPDLIDKYEKGKIDLKKAVKKALKHEKIDKSKTK